MTMPPGKQLKASANRWDIKDYAAKLKWKASQLGLTV